MGDGAHVEGDAVEAAFALGRDAVCVGVPEHPVFGDEALREGVFQRGFIDGRGALDAGVALGVA